jgi:4'-phosphopantetheinyl transferase EntD
MVKKPLKPLIILCIIPDMEVYVLYLDTLRPCLDRALAALSPMRREKAMRRRPEAPRLQSVGAGLLLRCFFGPEDPLEAPGGKPFFPGKRPFSLTHSGGLAAVALGERSLGLDAERIAPVSGPVARRTLSPEELDWLSRQGPEGFAFLWTRKEAVLKCLGTGVDRPLSSFSVLPGEAVSLEGEGLALHSVKLDEYMLSAACEKDAVFTPRVLTAEELLRMI